jgi:hypothetical protein
VREVDVLLRDAARADAIGAAGRAAALRTHSWPAQLATLDRHLDALRAREPLAA